MPQILVQDLAKTYRVAERDPGVLGAMRGLVHRRWRTVQALTDVSFSLERGELLGFIGPNGAGKSTTIKILSGILRPDGGRVEVDGLVPWQDRVRHVARIGVVFGQRTQLWWDLSVGDGFDLLRDIYRVDPARYRTTREELVALLRLERIIDQPVRQLSLGQRMRAEIAAALLHEPQVLFLDEAPELDLADLPGVAVRARAGRALELAFDPQLTGAPALIAAITARHAVDDIHVEQPAIEEVIARFYDLHGAGEA
jgi:ABC-2 type transport system ATP-binding protein